MLFLKLGSVQDFPFIDPPDFKFVKEEKVFPSENGFDGFYMALLQKNN